MSEINKYRFYLNFKNDGSFGRIEISEPVGFDGSAFTIEQDNKRYGRDAQKISEEIELSFYKGSFDNSDLQQTLPNGTVIYHLTQGFDWIIDVYKRHGFQADVDFEIESEGVTFIPANLDFQTSETDGFTYITCKALQQQGKQQVKRRSDIVTDIFSTEDLDSNEVTPAQTENILIKAKPTTGLSSWKVPTIKTFVNNLPSGGSNVVYFNDSSQVVESKINNTLSYLPFFSSVENDTSDAVYIEALNDLSNVSINLDLEAVFQKTSGDFTNPVGASIDFFYNIFNDIDNPIGSSIASGTFFPGNGFTISDSEPINNITYNDSIEGLNIPRGYRMSLYFRQSTAFLGGGVTTFTVNKEDISITATETAINTVVKGVRYIDVFKENLKRISTQTVNAPRFDEGSEYYGQFAFTGQLIKQRTDLPFPVKFKDITEDLAELNCDYQILNDELFIGRYEDFYPAKELGVFIQSPDESFKSTFNERYAINQFEYKYKNFEQDRDEENTTDAIHTETQWYVQNDKVENTKTVDIDIIRDPFKIQALLNQLTKETTSTQDDDKMIVVDVVRLAPNTKGGFSALMTHNIDDDGNVQVLKDADLPSWALLGFDVGDSFEILSEDNEGAYTVAEIDTTIITLTPVSPNTQSFAGESYTEVEYPLTNVAYVNRTNEDLEFFDNLLNGDNYSNLKYSIKRNIKTWFPYLATASKYIQNKVFKNTYFKDNSECTTRFSNETENIIEGADINNVDFGDPILTPLIYETKLVVPFADMVSAIEGIDIIEDGKIGGFFRCISLNGRVIKLYSQKTAFLPSKEVLELVGEERYEGDMLIITTNNSEVIINEVGYDLDTLNDPFYEMDGNYLNIYDSNKLPVINPTRFDEVQINNQTFSDKNDLMTYLINL